MSEQTRSDPQVKGKETGERNAEWVKGPDGISWHDPSWRKTVRAKKKASVYITLSLKFPFFANA